VVRGLSILSTFAGRSAGAFLAFLRDLHMFNIMPAYAISTGFGDLMFRLIRRS